MQNLRTVVFCSLCFAALSGCGQHGGFPNIPATMTTSTQDAPWPGFLPMSLILAGSPEDFDLTQDTIAAMQARVARLRRKARILGDPILTERERRDMMRAVRQHNL